MSDAGLLISRAVSGDEARRADEWYRLGLALHAGKLWGAAAGCFARAGSSVEALANRAWNMHLTGRTAEALAVMRRAEDVAPEEQVPHTLLGQLYGALGKDALAVEEARFGVERSAESPIAHMALAFALMLHGEWAEGWREYEWRFPYKLQRMWGERRDAYGSIWRGEEVDRLFVECEQGLGDTIFGARWLREAVKRCGRLEVHVQPELYGLFSAEFGGEMDVRSIPRPLPHGVDAWCPMMSLPVALGEDVGEPFSPGVMFKNGGTRSCGGQLRVGICWQGNPEHEQAHHRDCPLAYWLRLTENVGVRLHSLQYKGTDQLGQLGCHGLIEDRAPEITNFSDAARVIEGLDLVVTVDTAAAHLAGAMGVPVWLLLNQRGKDFRWGRGNTTGWYPSIRIFNRDLNEDWSSVMKKINDSLLDLPRRRSRLRRMILRRRKSLGDLRF